MAKLRIRFVINKGRQGAPLGKLGSIQIQADKFLRAISVDCGVPAKPGEWLAADFANGSVMFDATYQGAVDPGIAQVFEYKMEVLADFDSERDGLNGIIRESTALEYAKIGRLIDPDEEIGIEIFPHRGGMPKRRTITYQKSQTLTAKVEAPIPAYGSVQGVIHAWVKGAAQPYVQIRELSTNELVKVEYSQAHYSQISKAMEEKNAVVMVSGECSYDQITHDILRMRLDRLSKTANLTTLDFDALFGSFPEFDQGDLWEDAS
ncbi:hypothetical protein QKW60_04515 [Defluviimonas aestuarii]|uniref:hypothetical protein n=1 Tax=Albidovulum aestuarii TaxID=1130726 RepID=UPI00249A4C70|nr:hypothetical protein [Defluviimonas aestuarii]MDI3335655.1 hypothetical protein [Defluviimonas aestuarii]